MFFGYFFVWVPIFDPTLVQYFIQIPHIIFCCPLSAYDKWWFEQKKSPHFREKYLVLSYLKNKKKKSVLLHGSQFIQANVRNPSKFILPPLDSAFDRLKMNSSRLSARFHSCGIEPLEVMALAGRLAGPDNAVYVPSLRPGLRQLAEWKETKESRSSFLRSNIARLGGVKLHFRCCRYILD